MSPRDPDLIDYLRLFEPYGDELSSAYLQPNDGRYEFVFERAARLLARPSAFNATLPKPFCVTAQKYLAGDERTVRHMSYPENHHFMLSDLYDFVVLSKAQNTKARRGSINTTSRSPKHHNPAHGGLGD